MCPITSIVSKLCSFTRSHLQIRTVFFDTVHQVYLLVDFQQCPCRRISRDLSDSRDTHTRNTSTYMTTGEWSRGRAGCCSCCCSKRRREMKMRTRRWRLVGANYDDGAPAWVDNSVLRTQSSSLTVVQLMRLERQLVRALSRLLSSNASCVAVFYGKRYVNLRTKQLHTSSSCVYDAALGNDSLQ